MLIYIIKSTACLTILYLFYRVFLEKATAHIFKRFYLLGALLLSLTIPLIVFVKYVPMSTLPETNFLNPITPISAEDQVASTPVFDILPFVWSFYFLGLVLFGFRFARNLVRILQRIRNNPKKHYKKSTHVLLKEKLPPHTFLKFIFLNKLEMEKHKIPKEVLIHEETHVIQKHSLDVIFMELIQVVFWFNPLIIFFKRAIKLNHEFLADQAVLSKNLDPIKYQNVLLEFSAVYNNHRFQPALSNAIHYSSIKKRIKVMKTKTSRPTIIIRSLLLLPILTLLLMGFSDKKTVPQASNEDIQFTVQDTLPIQMEDDHMTNTPTQEGASRKLMAEYNKLARHYNNMPKNAMRVLLKDVERLTYIYNLMSEKQRADAEPFPQFPEPPPPPQEPKVKEIKEVPPPQSPVITEEVKELPPPPPKSKEIQEVPPPTKNPQVLEVSASAEWPRAPAISYLINKNPMSSELKALVKKYVEKRKNYYDGVVRLVMHDQGNKEQLKHEYKELMALYENYKKLANKEGVFARPEPGMVSMVWDRLPPHGPFLIDHVVGLAGINTTFYYDNHKISDEKAVELLRKNHELRIKSILEKDGKTEVRMSSS
nr:M56 family metallopeptidase [Allomuricauda sp.]